MPDLVPAPLATLLKRAYYELRTQQSIYDLPCKDMYRGSVQADLSTHFHGLPVGTPLGPAAGPQDQLAQNIVLAWLGGSRIIELKTVQILDELTIHRPCIDATNIGFNIEWSQELKLQQSLQEYVKAAMIIEILRAENVLDIAPDAPPNFFATVYDLSVGYDLKGIQSEAVSGFIQQIKHAEKVIEQLRAQIPDEYAQYRDHPYRSDLVKTVTLSTFHGCPRDEIERICRYLLSEMGLHTIIKLNPVQLGQVRLEHILHERLGYTHLKVNQQAYESGLSLAEAVQIVERLEPLAKQYGLNIGVKFSNTLEVYNSLGRLPDEVMYLSGQPLHVIAVALLAEWRKVAGTRYPVSFAAGIERRNVANAVAMGLTPITVCTDLLRPRGYGRQEGYFKDLALAMHKVGATTIPEYILKARGQDEQVGNDLSQAILRNTALIAEETVNDTRYGWAQNSKEPRKISSHLYTFDCLSCDKCVPVCPNDANFIFEVEPVHFAYRDYRLTRGQLLPDERRFFSIEQVHQLANYVDFCNECGNCDTFCPEYGGPFIEKPGFFGSRAAFEQRAGHDGFYVEVEDGCERITGRIQGQVYRLEVQRSVDQAVFSDGVVELTMQLATQKLLSWRVLDPTLARLDPAREPYAHAPDHVVALVNYYRMEALLRGVLNQRRVHYVNAPFYQHVSSEAEKVVGWLGKIQKEEEH
ncbi:MAG TPA: 4Fe-4S dicluster domain-containing protein [Ktedonobacteraceae bacterium]|nr:4Fe-4S dicluster domain-containing protein [Ktedonobacteraceae bacterium]